VAVVLDAKLDPRDKIALAPTLLSGVDSDDPRGGLDRAIESERGQFTGDDEPVFSQMADRIDGVVVAAVAKAFKPAYLITAGLALLAALVLVLGASVRLGAIAATAALAAAAVFGAVALDRREGADRVAIANPCDDRPQPDSGGFFGAIQDFALNRLDNAACEYGSSREELVLAIADDAEYERYKAKYDVDPRSAGDILGGLFG
jgi:hypothetical protein